MVKVNIYKKFFEKKVLSLIKQDKLRHQERIVYYLKLYTNLMAAEVKLSSRRGFDHINIVIHMTKSESFQGEAHYLNYINSIVRDVMSNRKRIQRILSKDPAADPLNAKTQLLMAQNICVLRILKTGNI